MLRRDGSNHLGDLSGCVLDSMRLVQNHVVVGETGTLDGNFGGGGCISHRMPGRDSPRIRLIGSNVLEARDEHVIGGEENAPPALNVRESTEASGLGELVVGEEFEGGRPLGELRLPGIDNRDGGEDYYCSAPLTRLLGEEVACQEGDRLQRNDPEDRQYEEKNCPLCTLLFYIACLLPFQWMRSVFIKWRLPAREWYRATWRIPNLNSHWLMWFHNRDCFLLWNGVNTINVDTYG